MRAIKLQYLDTPSCYIQPAWYVNNKLYLDYDDEFRLSLNKEIQQLTDVNKIAIETALGTSLPATAKNLAILGIDINYNLLNVPVIEHKVLLDLGFNSLRHDSIKVVSYSKNTNRIEIQIIDGSDNWITKIKSIYLDDLPFQSFEYSKTNLVQNMTFNAKYITGDVGYYFPFVNYGSQIDPDQISEGDFRPWIHSKKIYELLSKELGVVINFPLLDTEVGARHINYLLKENISEDADSLDRLKFKAVTTIRHDFARDDNYVNEIIKFDKEILDNGNNYDPTSGQYTGSGFIRFIVKLDYHLSIQSGGLFVDRTFIDINLVQLHSDGRKTILANFNESTKSVTFDDQITFIEEVLVLPGDKIYVEYNAQNGHVKDSFIRLGCEFYNEPINFIITAGQILNIQKSLRHDLVLDYIKGDCHLFNIKILEERHTNTIHFLTPYDTDYYGDAVSGYMTNITKSFLNLQVQKEEIITTPLEVTKNKLFKFKDSTDPKVTETKPEKYQQPFVKFIDNGFEKINENDISENPYFEPTINRDFTIQYELGSYQVDCLYMVDNADGQISYKFTPRKAIAYGMTELYYIDNTFGFASVNSIIVGVMGELWYKIPYAFQLANSGTSSTGVYPNETLNIPTWKLVYGDYEDDLVELFYRKWMREFENRHTSKMKMLPYEENYFTEYFRKRVEVLGIDGNCNGRFISINSYNPETHYADYEFVPDNQSTDECDNFVAVNPCKNYPDIVITINLGENEFSLGGVSASPIASTKFEWTYEDLINFQEGNSIGFPVKPYIVRMTVTYSDGCKQLVIKKLVDPCGNSPKICFSVVNDCLIIQECGTHNSVIDSILIEYSQTQVAPYDYKTYNDCIDIKTFSSAVKKIHARITVTYVDGCKTLPKEDDFFLTYTAAECPDLDSVDDAPSVIAVTVAAGGPGQTGGFELWRIGGYNCCAAKDEIQYRKKSSIVSDDEWRVWVEGQVPLLMNQDYEIKRIIQWCNNKCKTWCSPVVYAMRGCQGNVNIGDTITSCIHTLKWQHPVNAVNEWLVDLIKDQDFFVPELKSYLETNCAGVITTSYNKRILYDRWNFRTQYQISWQPGYKIENMEIHQNIAGFLSSTITIPVNVTYTAGDDNTALKQAIKTSVESYLSSNYTAVNGVHYSFDVEILGTGTNRTTKLIWWAKNVFTATWYGAQAPTDLLYMRDTLNVQTTVASTKLEIQKIDTSDQKAITFTPCGTELRVKFSAGVNKYLDDSLSNFDTFTQNANIPIVSAVETSITETCNKHILVAQFTCAGVASYIWKYGQTTISETDTVTVSGVGKIITLLANCIIAGLSCTFKKQITLT